MPKLPKDYLKTHSNRFLRMVSKAREADKVVNTFIEGLKGYIHNGRIYADINQIRSDQGGTVTGRFSMSIPNLQQIPAKGYMGKKMRELFIPEDGHKWGSFDYSQQEPRIVVHYAIKHKLSETKELGNKFKNNKADFHKIVAKMANIPREQAKTINLGLFYGMGKGKLQQELHLDKAQAKKLFDTYHEKVPFVKELSDNLIYFAKDNKLIFTLEDRFCRFDKYENVNKKWDNNERKFKEWDPEAKEIKNKDGTISYQGEWIIPRLLTKEQADKEFKKLFNSKFYCQMDRSQREAIGFPVAQYGHPIFKYVNSSYLNWWRDCLSANPSIFSSFIYGLSTDELFNSSTISMGSPWEDLSGENQLKFYNYLEAHVLGPNAMSSKSQDGIIEMAYNNALKDVQTYNQEDDVKVSTVQFGSELLILLLSTQKFLPF